MQRDRRMSLPFGVAEDATGNGGGSFEECVFDGMNRRESGFAPDALSAHAIVAQVRLALCNLDVRIRIVLLNHSDQVPLLAVFADYVENLAAEQSRRRAQAMFDGARG